MTRKYDNGATRTMALQRRDSDLEMDVKMDDVVEGSRSPPQLLQDDKAITVSMGAAAHACSIYPAQCHVHIQAT